MFQRERLLKTRWGTDAQKLAEELWCMMDPDVPLEHSAPIILYQVAGEPVIDIRGTGDGEQIIRFGGAGNKDLGNLTLDLSNGDVTIPDAPLDSGNPNAAEQRRGGGGAAEAPTTVFSGTIASGSGATYTATIATGDVEGTVPGINTDETIPVGTPCIVIKLAGAYTIHVPLWM